MPRGFTLERTETRAEGTCADCADYERGLRKGTTTIATTGALAQPPAQGMACVLTEGPLGPIALAASDEGLLRIAFDGHGDAGELRARAASRRGSREARAHVERAASELQDYLHGRSSEIGCPVDWSGLPGRGGRGLPATRGRPRGHASDPVRRSPLLLGPGQRATGLRHRADHGRQPDPDRRSLSPRDPRDRASAGLRRRPRAPALAGRARAPARRLRRGDTPAGGATRRAAPPDG